MVEDDWTTMVLLEDINEERYRTFDLERIDAIEKELKRIESI